MGKYLRIYRELLKFSATRDMTYRAGFLLKWLMEIVFAIIAFMGARVLFWNMDEIAGWNFNRMLILIGVNEVFWRLISGTVFIWNLRNLPGKIVSGELDMILLKPLNSQFIVSLWYPYFASFPSVIAGLLLIFYGAGQEGINIGLAQLLPFAVIFISGLIIAYSLGMIFATFSFWLLNAPLPILAERLIFFTGKNPYDIYTGVWRIVFSLILPLAFMVSFPAKTLLGELVWWWVPMSVILAAVFLKISNLFWNFGLKRYTSTGS